MVQEAAAQHPAVERLPREPGISTFLEGAPAGGPLKQAVEAVDGRAGEAEAFDLRAQEGQEHRGPEPAAPGHEEEVDVVRRLGPAVRRGPGDARELDPRTDLPQMVEEPSCLRDPALREIALPQALRRADGRSIYRPHSGTRHATQAQLTMEERLAAQAQQAGAPRPAAELAACLPGAGQAQAEAYALQGSLPAAIEQLQLAQKSGDGDFYQLSTVDARLRDLRAQLAQQKKDNK